jgi:hypothetical protein
MEIVYISNSQITDKYYLYFKIDSTQYEIEIDKKDAEKLIEKNKLQKVSGWKWMSKGGNVQFKNYTIGGL